MADKSVPILVVEDSPTSAVLTEHWLREGLPQEVELQRAETAESAVAALADRHFDVVVLDLNLPDSQGIETYRRVQEASPTTPIVILSSESNEEIAIEAVRLGAQDYVVKESGARNVLARPVRYAIERSRRQEAEEALRESNRQMFVARSIQRHLLAYKMPHFPGLQIAGYSEPADLTGGDFYDFIPAPDGSLGIVIGDVSGHGLPSTLMMVETRAVLRALTRACSNVSVLLSEANEILAPDLNGSFVTLFFAQALPNGRVVRYSSAGHPGLLLTAAGEFQRLVATTLPLGVTAQLPDVSDSESRTLAPGDLLVLYTDGIIETFSPDGELFGEKRLREVILANHDRTCAEIVGAVFEAVHDFRGQQTSVDDNTIVVVKAMTHDGLP